MAFSNWPSIEQSYGGEWGKIGLEGSKEKGKTDWGSIFSDLIDKTQSTDKYRSFAEQSKPYFGEGSKGGGSQILENLGVVYPQQHGPIFQPGVQGSPSAWGKIGQAVGTIGGAFIGPAGARIGGQLGGTIGGFFD